jgi:hypothetical protein
MIPNIVSFYYNGTPIEFELTPNSVMANATEMAKPFGKKALEYLSNQQTIDFIEECCKDENFYKIMGLDEPISTLKNDSEGGNSHLQKEESDTKKEIEDRKSCFVKVIHGGAHRGTWMHRYLAIDFARWLNPAFNLWVTMIIDNIIFGYLKDVAKSMQRSVELQAQKDMLAKKLKSENDIYKQIAQLELAEKQEVAHRNKLNKSQMDLFKDNVRHTYNSN